MMFTCNIFQTAIEGTRYQLPQTSPGNMMNIHIYLLYIALEVWRHSPKHTPDIGNVAE